MLEKLGILEISQKSNISEMSGKWEIFEVSDISEVSESHLINID